VIRRRPGFGLSELSIVANVSVQSWLSKINANQIKKTQYASLKVLVNQDMPYRYSTGPTFIDLLYVVYQFRVQLLLSLN